ncbi:helix-turn-helix transcriptional regulator [Pseudoteredinibacter isoporae]|uniref:AraC-like DNA-binding protein n=1 Tax=Pseudoteredinibacter isoporae TaxID=570281 RepID=A0A7X0JQR7_9GAMM|nr:helix-turn-helix transcriptional regulator [Pseudoteredinibacter isoporae]MBB6520572.1 AraC-like DNA-binding protein [Pseudoteredinibacter isoporae]NHO86139.1 helix-turn-helix transcriptional regulator [Pseudoteredinibacter isoporae]NIB25410.1 helix-turn-helix transcriptional regulator [Pseudoteredinibacter isoporae]
MNTLALTPPARLGAENYLLDSLKPQWQSRMATATRLIRQRFNEAIDWNWLAQQCAVSPSHFHYVFKNAFNEGPGQFQRRMRLQYALSQLQLSDKSVTDVALESGFSSSQALAKALRRVLGLSASDVRQLCSQRDAQVWKSLLPKLGQPHPDHPESLDNTLLDRIEIRLEQRGERYLYLYEANARSVGQIYCACSKYLPLNCDTVFVYSPWEACANPAMASYYWGYEAKVELANYQVPARTYLCATVVIDSEASYLMVWEAIYRRLSDEGLQIDYEAFLCDEIAVQNRDDGGMLISICLPVVPSC